MALGDVSRRDFLATTATWAATIFAATRAVTAPADQPAQAVGAVVGRVGRAGIAAGNASAPSRGEVVLLDGRVVSVTHVSRPAVRAGASVLLIPDQAGSWSILYAEV